jgi:two-component sensor histidine kinase
VNEQQRLDAVRRYEILDTLPDRAFDRITAIASRLLAAPMALISVVDADRIWFKSHHGLELEQVDREPGFCASCILQDRPWVVTDAKQDPRAAQNSLVNGAPEVRFYLGVPVCSSDGIALGTLSVLDTSPRSPSERDLSCLSDLAGIVMDELELRLTSTRALANYHGELMRREQLEERTRALERELAHRSRNLLAIVQSVVQQSKVRFTSVEDYADRLAGRIQSLARTHDLIIADAWEGVTLDDLIRRQIEALVSTPERLRISGPTVVLTPASAQTLGMALHELAVNCLRHGVCSDPSGHVDVLWSVEPTPEGPALHLLWREYGATRISRTATGFGQMVLERLTAQALNGRTTWSNRPDGTMWEFVCPLENAGQLG